MPPPWLVARVVEGGGVPYLLGSGRRQVNTRSFQVASQLRERQQQVGVLAGWPRSCERGHELLDCGDIGRSGHKYQTMRSPGCGGRRGGG
jgi:hypothetical protein